MSIKWLRTFKLASFLVLSGAFALKSENAISQNIVPDNTLGKESSTVTPNVEINGVESDKPNGMASQRLEGGAQRGANLFHSFEEFNVDNGRKAYFSNPIGIKNIFSRVTGANASEILGTLGVSGNADLFLLNPNGIIFGENARLDVSGSFVGSTANSINFADGNQFSANKLDNPPLLTVNVPIGLGFLDNPGKITNRSTVQNSAGEVVGLEVNPVNSITLLGGDLNFDGGHVTARSGNIKLGGLVKAGTVGISDDGNLNFPQDTVRANITLSNAADIDVRGNGGSIDIQARNLIQAGGSSIRAGITKNSTLERIQAGNITIDVAEDIAIDGSLISNSVEANAVGNSGNINITTANLNLTNGARVETSTSGRGNSGVVRIMSDAIAIDPVEAIALPNGIFSQVKLNAGGNSGGVDVSTTNLDLTNGGRIASNTGGSGKAGGVNIVASDTINLDGQRFSDALASGIVSQVDLNGNGNSGNVNIATANLNLTNGARIETSTFGRGNSGVVRIMSDAIAIDTGEAIALPSGIFSQVKLNAEGNSGGVDVSTTTLDLTNGGRIASNTGGSGKAGGVNIVAGDTITLDGQRSNGTLASGIASRVDVDGKNNSGGVNITTTNLTMTGGAEIDVDTYGKGNAGSVNITASNNVTFDGENYRGFGSGVNSSVRKGATGNAGLITISAANITMTDGGSAAAGTFTRGDAGSIDVNASNNIIFDGEDSRGLGSGIVSSINKGGVGNAGKIDLTTANLTMTNGGRIDASTLGQGNAGEVRVTATGTISIDGEGSRIRSPASGITNVINNDSVGSPEGVTIDTKNLILTNGGLISSGTFGQGNSGSIEVTATDTITIDGENSVKGASQISSTVNEGASGDSSGIKINTGDLILTNGGLIFASTAGQGNSGSVEITASNTISIDGENSGGFGSGITSQVLEIGVGNATGIAVDTVSLSITNGGRIAANTLGKGNAGDLVISSTESIILDGVGKKFRSNLSANALINNGEGGNLKISSDRLTVKNGAAIEASNLDSLNNFESGTGQPGKIDIKANSIVLANKARIDTATQSPTGVGGILKLVAENIILRDNSLISARAFDNADGGNLNINTGFLIASPNQNSNIIARASLGKGGNITIDADSLFGIEERPPDPVTNDIDASSEFGLSGIVEINTPDVDRDRDLVQLPTQPVETRVVPACTPSEGREKSEFVIKGRGGLPPSPESVLDSNSVEADWIARPPQSNQKIANPISDEPAPIIEAQGWVVDDNNEIVLVADNPQNQSWQNLPQCQKKVELKIQKYHNAKEQNYSLLFNNSDKNILIASTEPKSLTARVPERITVDRFEVEGNQAFDSEELAKVLAPYKDKPLSFSELLQARSAITQYYTERGYITSGAYIPRQRLQDKVVKIQIVEGYLEDIKIMGNKRLNSDYLSDRIETASDSLQQEELLSALQLLQQDPLITSISAELEAGTRPGANVLEVEVIEADSFQTPIMLDNRRTPSVGSFRRQLALDEGNLLGFGDNLFLAYSNTEGSDAFDGSYALPFNARNGTLTLSGGLSSSEVVEEPFNQLNILGDSHYYELSLRQPIIQTPTQEFALGITASRRNSDISSLLEEFDVPLSELSPGADEQGQTRVSALRFFQEWTSRNSREVIAARSQFNLGLDVFDATVNKAAPDSRFFAWQGQAQWARQLAPDTLFLLRGGIQLATTSLLSSEQFGLGGLETLRGYRQDLLLTDNAAFASAEIRLPIFRIDRINSVFQLAPFFDVGTAWNNRKERDRSPTNTLASIGLGLRLLFNSFTARLDWGIPLISVNSEKKTWQENGLYFSVEYNPF